jgi:hypothetical protein
LNKEKKWQKSFVPRIGTTGAWNVVVEAAKGVRFWATSGMGKKDVWVAMAGL